MRFNKKELFIVIGIFVVILGLAFSTNLGDLFRNKKQMSEQERIEPTILQEEKTKYVQLTITGELLVDELKLNVPYGYSFGNIVGVLQGYANAYSILKFDDNTRFYEDTSLVIQTTDSRNSEYYESEEKIIISKASREELIQLYGIGEKRAERIIEYRQDKRITSFDELKSIIGVSNEVIDRIKKQAIL